MIETLWRRFRSVAAMLVVLPVLATAQSEAFRPNVLWLTSEDHGPHMGCYGDPLATTPNVDRLATQGLRYNRAWSNAPVCAPARTALISGLYPTSTGGQHMRSAVPVPTDKPLYPTLLRDAGYYTTNNSKTDYNFIVSDDIWDETSNRAHWRNRPEGQPFFAIFNAVQSHESRLRVRPHDPLLDAARITPPPYHPNEPAVRKDWAQYYDTITLVDALAGERLAELAAAGLTEDTIVFYFGDHGSGMPGSKRNPNNAGLQIPLIVYIPEKFAHLRPADYVPGGASDRLVSFVDFAPTLLSLIGIEPPDWMQGRAFLGAHIAPAPAYNHGFRGRMDERTDFVRTVTDGRYVYVRNFRPDLPAGQYVGYQYLTPATRIWHDRWAAGETNAVQSAFWEPTPPEQLFDLSTDPHEVVNLAQDPAQTAVRQRLRQAMLDHAREIRDVGFLPEGEFHRRAAGAAPYDWARTDDYPEALIAFVDEVTNTNLPAPSREYVLGHFASLDPAERYWMIKGATFRGSTFLRDYAAALRALRHDLNADVQIAAAEALVRIGDDSGLAILARWADPAEADFFACLAALSAIDNLGAAAASLHDTVAGFPREAINLPHPRYGGYIGNLIEHLLNEHLH